MNYIVGWFSTLVRKLPWVVVGTTLLLFMVFGALAGNIELETGNDGFAPDNEELQASDRIRDLFGEETSEAVLQVVLRDEQAGDVITAEALRAVIQANQAIESAVPNELSPRPQRGAIVNHLGPVIGAATQQGLDPMTLTDQQVKELYTQTLAESDAATQGFLSGLLSQNSVMEPSPVSSSALMLVFLEATPFDADEEELEGAIQVERDIEAALNNVNTSLQMDAFSFNLLFDSAGDFEGEILRLFLIAALIIVFILMFVYWLQPTGNATWSKSIRRTVADMGITMLTIIAAITFMNGIGYLLVQINVMSGFTAVTQIVPILMIGLGVDYGIHLTARYREEVGEGAKVEGGINRAIRTVGIALSLATVTTAVGFLTNLFNPIPALKDFGILAAVGVLCSFLLMLTFVPSSRLLFDRRAERTDRLSLALSEAIVSRSQHDPGFRRRWAETLAVRSNQDYRLRRRLGLFLAHRADIDDQLSVEDIEGIINPPDQPVTVSPETYRLLITRSQRADALGDALSVFLMGWALEHEGISEETLAMFTPGPENRKELNEEDWENILKVVALPDRLPTDGMSQTGERLLPSIMERLAVLSERFVLPTLAVTVLFAGFGIYGLTQVDTEFSFVDFLPEDAPIVATFDVINEEFGGGFAERTQVLVETSEGGELATPTIHNAMVDFSNNITNTADVVTYPLPTGEVAQADSPINAIRSLITPGPDGMIRDPDFAEMATEIGLGEDLRVSNDTDVRGLWNLAAERNPEVMGRVASATPDGRYEAVLFDIQTQASETRAAELQQNLGADFLVLEDVGTSVIATSDNIINAVIINALSSSQVSSLLITLAVAAVVLMINFWFENRRPLLGVLTMLPVAVVVLGTFGLMWASGIPFGPVTATLAALAVGIGVPFTIHIARRFEEDRAVFAEVADAMRSTMRHTGGALAGSGLTTIAGFGILITSSLVPFQQMGQVTVYAIGLSLLCAVLVLPSLLALWEGYHRRNGRLSAVAADASGTDLAKPLGNELAKEKE